MTYLSTSSVNIFFSQNIALRTLISKREEEEETKAKVDSAVAAASSNSDEPPESYICQLERKVMTYPVYLPCGHYFSKSGLNEHFTRSYSCPSCSRETFPYEAKKHHKLFAAIHEWISHKPFVRNPADAQPHLPPISPSEGGEAPSELLCPIEYTLMQDPVYSTACKHAFGKRAIRRWIAQKINPDCPICHTPISLSMLKSWTIMKEFIANWQKNQSR